MLITPGSGVKTEPKVKYRRLHLPVNALAQNMFSHDAKRLRFRCQTLKFSHPNVKFPRQSFAVITVKMCAKFAKIPSLTY